MSPQVIPYKTSFVQQTQLLRIIAVIVAVVFGVIAGFYVVTRMWSSLHRQIAVTPVPRDSYLVSPESFAKDREEFAEAARKVQLQKSGTGVHN